MFVNARLTMISPLNFKPNAHLKSASYVSKTPQCHVSLDFLVAHCTQCILLPCWKIIPLPITYFILLQLSWQEILLTSESLKMTLAYTWHLVKWSEVKLLSHVRLFATTGTVAYKAPLSMEFSRQEYWSGLPLPSPGDLPDPGIKRGSPALQADSSLSEPPGKPQDCRIVWGFSGSSVVRTRRLHCCGLGFDPRLGS